MTISKPSQLTLDNMMSSQEVSPVKTLVSQEEEKELQTNPDQVYFTNSSESYAWYDQNSLSWKTWQRSLITDWTSFSESFPKQGTMQNGQLYLQVHWEPPTDVVGGGALPTPTTMDHLPPRSVSSMIKQTQVHRKGRTSQQISRSSKSSNSRAIQSSTDVTNSNSKGLQRKIFSKMESGIWSAKHTRRLDPNWRSYVSKPILPRGSYGLSNRVDRTKALGNSIVPAVAAIPLQRVHDLYYK